MALTAYGRPLQRVGVVGAGKLGPDLALYFSRVLAPHGVPVVLHDVSGAALEAGRERISQKLAHATDSGQVRSSELRDILGNLAFTQDRSLLHGSGLVVEAVSERLDVKLEVFAELEHIVAPGAVLASSSSHFEPERLFACLRRPERAMIHHFFYPADRNPLVELVAGPGCQVAAWSARFYESLGKVPVSVGSRFGYAVNPIFEGLVLAALLLEEQGHSPGTIDAIACRALGLGAGPFGVVNAIGGAPALQAALLQFGRTVMPWFRSPASLDEQVATRAPWRTADRGETASYSSAMYENISSRLLGAYCGLALEVLDSGLTSLGDLNLAVQLGLAIRAPFELMNELGPVRVRELVEAYAAENPGFRLPRETGPFDIPLLAREDQGDVAVVKIRRPRELNRLTIDVYRQLDREFAAIRDDARFCGAVLTGFGTKAFSEGADLERLAGLPSPAAAADYSAEANAVLRRIETLGKPVVAALNGPSVGAGSELAYAATARVARKGTPSLFAHPDVRWGLLPATGGTQRLPRLIEFPAAWRILRTGGSISGEEAARLGLVLEEVDGDPVSRAVELARTIRPAVPGEPRVPALLPELDLGPLSRRIDEILRKAILEGARGPLEAGLAVESRCFGEAWATRDRRIGLDHVARTGSRQAAAFVHA